MGPYNTLFSLVSGAVSLLGASVVMGEEMIVAQDQAPPMVVIVPVGGAWNPAGTPGYYQDANTDLNNIWMTQENVDLYLWSMATFQGADIPDHYDATNDLRGAVLQSLQNQAPSAFMWRPMTGRWVTMQNSAIRAGRAYVLTVQLDITLIDALPVPATITSITETTSI